MEELDAVNIGVALSALGVLWRIVWYQGQQILKLTERQDVMWAKCFEQFVDSDNKSE